MWDPISPWAVGSLPPWGSLGPVLQVLSDLSVGTVGGVRWEVPGDSSSLPL